jgi:hypothetical protein
MFAAKLVEMAAIRQAQRKSSPQDGKWNDEAATK